MFKKIVSALSIFTLLSFGGLDSIEAKENPAQWLAVTADGVPGSAPSPNTIKATGKGRKISKKKCKNNGRAIGAIAGGLFGASRGKNAKSAAAGAVIGAGVGATGGSAFDDC